MMKIVKSYCNTALVDYYGQIKEKIPHHVVMIDAGPILARARVSDVDAEAMTIMFEVLPVKEQFQAVLK